MAKDDAGWGKATDSKEWIAWLLDFNADSADWAKKWASRVKAFLALSMRFRQRAEHVLALSLPLNKVLQPGHSLLF